MFKYLLLLAGLAFIGANAKAEFTAEIPISTAAAAGSVSVSTSALTKINPTRSMPLRSGILVNQKATNNANMYGVLGNCSATPNTISNGNVIEIGVNDRERLIPVDSGTCLWLYSAHTSAETIYYQEVGQRIGQ